MEKPIVRSVAALGMIAATALPVGVMAPLADPAVAGEAGAQGAITECCLALERDDEADAHWSRYLERIAPDAAGESVLNYETKGWETI